MNIICGEQPISSLALTSPPSGVNLLDFCNCIIHIEANFILFLSIIFEQSYGAKTARPSIRLCNSSIFWYFLEIKMIVNPFFQKRNLHGMEVLRISEVPVIVVLEEEHPQERSHTEAKLLMLEQVEERPQERNRIEAKLLMLGQVEEYCQGYRRIVAKSSS